MRIETLNSADFDNPPKTLTKSHKYDTLSESAGSVAGNFCITDIKQAVKNPNRANIFVNGKYSFSLDISQLADHPLKIGQTLTSAELAEFHRLSTLGKLYTRTLEWVLTRPRSIKETRDYLRRKIYQIEHPSEQSLQTIGLGGVSKRGVHAPISSPGAVPAPRKDGRAHETSAKSDSLQTLRSDSEAIIGRLIKKGYLDDTKFANYLIENYHTKKGISQKRLILELRKKGISQSDIDIALLATPRDETTELRKIIAKKSPKYPDQKKLTTYLLRQGFTYEDIREALP